jgi:hypothetical protein
MKAQDGTATLDLALAASGLDQMTVVHRPRLLSDNGASYVAEDLAAWLNRQKIEHVRSAPYALPIPSLLGGDADVQPSAATAGWGHPQVRRQFQEPAFGRRRLWRRLAAARSRGAGHSHPRDCRRPVESDYPSARAHALPTARGGRARDRFIQPRATQARRTGVRLESVLQPDRVQSGRTPDQRLRAKPKRRAAFCATLHSRQRS